MCASSAYSAGEPAWPVSFILWRTFARSEHRRFALSCSCAPSCPGAASRAAAPRGCFLTPDSGPAWSLPPAGTNGCLRSSCLVWANLQLGSLHCPVPSSSLHSFVWERSGSGFMSSLPCAKRHISPRVHMPSWLNLHIFVLWNKAGCRCFSSSSSCFEAPFGVAPAGRPVQISIPGGGRGAAESVLLPEPSEVLLAAPRARRRGITRPLRCALAGGGVVAAVAAGNRAFVAENSS
mmetsp:Transcript_61172/g.170791  ORF Transcript_61172/g.170791 Transcript_61172/m.170791 type:complete len:235 (-) Transcript_61172:2-706(-)